MRALPNPDLGRLGHVSFSPPSGALLLPSLMSAALFLEGDSVPTLATHLEQLSYTIQTRQTFQEPTPSTLTTT